jgi:rhodanese-related sulfurtransferase
MASAMRIPILSVAFFDTIGVFLYVGVAIFLGALFHDAIEDTLAVLSNLGAGGLVIIAAVFGLFLFGKWFQRKKVIHELRMNRITPYELKKLIDKGVDPVILDIRPQELRLQEGAIPGSVMANEGDLQSIAALYPTHSEVVVYCSCPNEASAVLLAKKLQKAGFKKIRPLLGGIDAWAKAGYVVDLLSPDNSLAA